MLCAVFQLSLPEGQCGRDLFLGSCPPRFFVASEAVTLIGGGATLGMLGSLGALLVWRS